MERGRQQEGLRYGEGPPLLRETAVWSPLAHTVYRDIVPLTFTTPDWITVYDAELRTTLAFKFTTRLARRQNAGGWEGDLRWTSIPSRGSSNTPSRSNATETAQ